MQYGQKNVVLFPEIGQLKIVLSLTRPHSQMCIRPYIFNQKKNKQARTQKAKETKEEKRISVKNLTGYDDVVCEFALCTFNLLNGIVNFSWYFT